MSLPPFASIFIIIILVQIQVSGLYCLENKELIRKPASLALYNSQNASASTNNYCQTCCIEVQPNTVGKKCGSHTMCKYENQEIGPACKGFVPVHFSQAEKRLIVDAHNTIRNRVASGVVVEGFPGPQPSASNMRAVEWDDELATIAERWASQCIFANDICRDLARFPVGQNIARGTIATDGELNLLKKWFQEVRNFDRKLVDSFAMPKQGGRMYTRYTQLVWADTYLIGCARVIFQSNEGAKVRYTEHLVCNYGPTGNIPNQKVYRIGRPCTECHEGTACNSEYESLCATDSTDVFDDYLINEVATIRSGVECTIVLQNYVMLLCLCGLFIKLN